MRNASIRLTSLPNFAQSEAITAGCTIGTRLGWAAVIAMTSTSNAFAASTGTSTGTGTGTDPDTFLSAIVTFITGNFGQSLAILGVIAIGLAWMFGRASLGLVAGVVGGIVIMFGASWLVNTVVGTGS